MSYEIQLLYSYQSGEENLSIIARKKHGKDYSMYSATGDRGTWQLDAAKAWKDLETLIEFPIGTEVTLDRYNAIGDEVKAEVTGYTRTQLGLTFMYILSIPNMTTPIQTSGSSIMESKWYMPVPIDERHPKL